MSKTPGWVQPLVDYAGLVLFAGAYVLTRDLMSATWGMVAGSVIGLVVGFVMQRRLAMLPAFTGGSALLFGLLSLIFHDSIFIKIKLTVIDGLLAAAMFGGLLLGKLPLKALLGEALRLPDATWRTLTFRYGVFFAVMAVANAVFAFGQPEAVWVAFRFPGAPIMAVLFSLAQAPMMVRAMRLAETDPRPPTD